MRGEVEAVQKEGLVRGRVPFAGGVTFDYVLEASPATVNPEAHMSNNVLTVRLPKETADRWAESDEVSIAAEQVLENGAPLSILVEKDFACLAPREGEDESDMFEHPLADEQRC